MDRNDWNVRYDTPELIWRAEPNQLLVEQIADLTAGRALDLACGEGRNAIWLAEQGWETTGVDFSSVAIRKAREFAKARHVRVDWFEADLRDFEPERDAYDLVLLAYVQLPEAERIALHQKAAGALRQGGRLLVIAHDSTNLEHGVGGPKHAEVLFTPEDVLRDVHDLGLTTERAEKVSRRTSDEPAAPMAIDALVRLQRPHKPKGDHQWQP